tara:strand:+ start:92 stop:346 length:255 start_codon:yes stop_codon:yes gene_type:complete
LNRVIAIIAISSAALIGCSWRMTGIDMTNGERLFRSNCRSCHILPNPKSQTDSDWVVLVNRYGSRLDLATEIQAEIIAHLQSMN